MQHEIIDAKNFNFALNPLPQNVAFSPILHFWTKIFEKEINKILNFCTIFRQPKNIYRANDPPPAMTPLTVTYCCTKPLHLIA